MADKKGGGKGKGKGGGEYKGRLSLYKVEGDKLVRARKACPKCGDGVFLAQHKDRESCGNCGYTEFTKKQAA